MGRRGYSMKKVEPFGVRYFEKPYIPTLALEEGLNWKLSDKARLDVLLDISSMPSTTGTGPGANTDEREEEM